MRRLASRALPTLALFTAMAGCASGGGSGVSLGGDTGGRYLVMIPDLEGPGGDEVAENLRALVTGMATHVAINERAIRESMAEYNVVTLDEIQARQLAQVVQAQLVSWGTVRTGAAGLVADMKFIDSRSGDEITLDDVSGATPLDLAGNLFTGFERSVEGIRQASFCNDYLSSNQYQEALARCDSALAIVPASTSALYGRATALLYLDREREALETYERLLAIDSAHQDALLGAGLAASRLGDSQRAMVFYNRYLEVNPGNVQVRMTVANDIAQTGDYVSAFRVLQTAVSENQENVEFQRYLFSIATAAGQDAMESADTATAHEIFAAALEAFDAAFEDTAQLEPAQVRQAVAVNSALGRTDEAIRIAREGTERFPDDAQVWSQLATVYAQARRHTDAIAAYDRVVAINPDYENVYIRRAQAKLEAGQRQQALADLELAARSGDRQTVAQVLYGMGAQAIQSENWTDAVAVLAAGHEYATGNLRSDIAFFWGYSLYKQGEAIARANERGNAEPARRALDIFSRALPILQGSTHAQAAQVIDVVRQYIDNQEATIRASQGG